MLRQYPLFLLGWFCLLPACAEHHEAAHVARGDGSLSQAIVNGKSLHVRDANDAKDPFDAVVKLSFRTSQTMCSGTLIAPDVVLTAAHCVPQVWGVGDGVQRLGASERLEVTFWRGGELQERRVAEAVAMHPAYRGLLRCSRPTGHVEHKACETFARQCGPLLRGEQDACLSALDKQVRHALGLDRLWPTHDVALVFLDTTAATTVPARIMDETCCENLLRAQAPVIVAGFGQQQDTSLRPGAIGAKVHGYNNIVDVGPGELRVDGGDKAHGCFGDSGGPVFAEVDHDGQPALVQVGVASRVWDYHPSRGCASGLAYVRIDEEADFIGASMRDACVEGVRKDCDIHADPQLASRRESVHASCSQGSVSWAPACMMVLWLWARRKSRRAACV